MIILFLPLIFAILNTLRGGGHISRLLCALSMGVSVSAVKIFQGYPIYPAIIIFTITFIGMWFGLVFGWGKYLNILSGNMQYVNEVEVKSIDWLTDRFCGKPKTSDDFVDWCFVALTLRGMIFYPVFIGLSFYNQNTIIIGLGCALMGAVYCMARFAPKQHQVRVGEFLYGGLLGLLISFSV